MQPEPAVANALIFSDWMIREQHTGKLSLIGIFDRLVQPTFPSQARFFVTVFLTHLHGERKPLSVTLRIEKSETGHVACSSMAKLQFPEGSPPFIPSEMLQVPLPALANFPEPGFYTAVVLVDAEEAGRATLRVDSATTAAQQPTRGTP